MPTPLRREISVIVFILVLLFQHVSAQVGCGSFSGTRPLPAGGASANPDPYTLCINDPVQVKAKMDINAADVADGSNPNNFAVVIDWDDGSQREEILYGGSIPITYNPAAHQYTLTVEHEFLPKACTGTMGRLCSYKPRIYLKIAGNLCTAEFGNPPDYYRYNTDDQCPGQMTLSESATGVTTFQVCAGTRTTVNFVDRTIINCLPPQEVTGLNSKRRWRRFVYGTVNSITEGGPADQVLIDGADIGAFPYMPSTIPQVTTDDLASSATPFANNNTLPITIPATAKVGDRFHIRLEYWNQCNVYDDGSGVPPLNGDRAPVYTEGIIEVVGQPELPTGSNAVVCNNIAGNLPDFSITFPGGSSRVMWYRDNNGVRGSSLTNPNGTNSNVFPVSAYPSTINKATAGVYRVWVKYRRSVNTNTDQNLTCDSDYIPVTLTIRPSVPNPVFSAGTAEVCNGATGVNYTLQIPASALTAPDPGNPAVSFNTEYIWSTNNAGVTITSTNPGQNATAQTATVNFSIPDGAFGGANSMTVNIQVQRRYTTNSTHPAPGSTCPSNVVSYPVTVYRNTSAGTLAGGLTACEGQDLGNVTWTPGVGTIQLWQLSSDGGVTWSTIGSFGTATTVSPTTLNLTHTGAPATPTEYRIRAQVQNGVCASVPTAAVIFNINENADKAEAGPDQPLCMLPPFTIPLAAGNATGTWSVVSKPAGSNPAFSNTSAPGAQFSSDAAGIYVLQWETSNGSCTSQDQVTITFGEAPDLPAPSAADFCGTTGTLSALAPLKNEIVTWGLVSGPGTATISNPGSNSSSVSVSAFGVYTFNIEFASPANCGSPQDVDVVYNFYQSPTSTPEVAKTTCVDGSVSPIAAIPILGASGGGALNGHWEIVTGTGLFSSSNAASGSVLPAGTINDGYVPSITDYNNGTVTLRLITEGNAICADAGANLVITFDRLPAPADAGTVAATCGTTALLNAAAPTAGGTGIWQEVTAGPTADTPLLRNSSVSDLIVGTNTFQWRVSSALGVCPASTDDVDVIRHAAPAAASIVIDNLCETVPNSGVAQNVNLALYEASITSAPNAVSWYLNAGRTTPVPAINNASVSGVLYVRVNRTDVIPQCTADAVVTFDIKKPPFVANLTPSICEDPATPGAVQNVNLQNYNDDVSLNLWPGSRDVDWFTDSGLNTPVAVPADQDNVLNSATYYARVRDVLTGCYTTATVAFEVNQNPVDNPVIGPKKVCLDAGAVNFFTVTNLNVGSKYKWTTPPPAAGVTNTTGIDTDFFVLLQFSQVVPGGHLISVTETSTKGCVGLPQTITVEVEDNPGSLTIAGPGEVCEGEVAVEYIADLFPNISYFWEVPAGSSIISGQGSNMIRINFAGISGNITVTPSTTLGCTGTDTSIPVVITPKPALTTPDTEVCSKGATNIVLTTALNEPDLTFNITTRVDDAGLAQTDGPVIPPGVTDVGPNFLASDKFLNRTGGPLTARYTIQPKILLQSNGRVCLGNPKVVTVRINPEPQLDPSLGKDLCSGEPTGVVLRSAVGNVKADGFIINAISNPGGLTAANPPPPIGVQLPETAVLDDEWVYNGFGPTFQTIEYEIFPVITSTGCIGTPSTKLQLRIFPKPVLNLPAPQTICNGQGQNISLTTPNVSTATISATVSYIDPNISGAQSQVSAAQPALITEVLMNNSFGAAGIVTYSIVAQNADNKSCISPAQNLTVTVNPAPEVNVPDPFDGCATVLNSGVYTATLADAEPLLTVPGNTIRWYSDNPDLDPGALQITTLTWDVQDMVPIFARISNTFNCSLTVPVLYDVANAVVLNVTATDATCFEAADGSIQANASFGSPPFTFRKNTDPAVNGSGALQDNFLFTGLGPANYTITVRDSRGCTATAAGVVNEPTPLNFAVGPVIKNVDCFYDPTNSGKDRNGQITVTASGSSGDYVYELSPGGYSQHITNGSQAVFNNLPPGSYALVITDFATYTGKKCKTEKAPVIVSVPTAVKISSVFVPTDSYGNSISCFGAQNGSVNVTTVGGTGTYQVTFAPYNPPAAVAAAENVPVSFQGLAPGSYTIHVVDGNGCQAAPEFATIIDVPVMTPGVVGSDRDVCFNQADAAGNATPFDQLVSAFGGNSGPYIYQWQTLDQATNTWVNIPGATTAQYDPDQSAAFTAVGHYYFRRGVANASPASKLTDHVLKGCDNYKYGNQVEVTVHPKPTTNVSVLGGVCKGDTKSVTLELLSGTAPMFFDFNDGTLNRNNQTGGQFSQPYQVVLNNNVMVSFTDIRDSYGCLADDQFIPIDVTAVSVDFDPDALAKCAGDAFNFKYIGYDKTLDYLWEYGDGNIQPVPAGPVDLVSQAYTYPLAITSQRSITFNVKLTASIGGACPASITKPVTVGQTINLNLSNPPNEICSGETITIQDNSTGVISGSYYYEDSHGTRGTIINGPLSSVAFLLPEGPDLPFTEYMIHYNAENNGCPASKVLGPVKVFRTPDADFTINPNPAKMVAGVVEVDFLNSTVPLDNSAFRYVYDYPIADLVSVTDPNPYDKHVVFSSEKEKEVILTVYNLGRPVCRSIHSEFLEVDLSNPLADFNFSPSDCTPVRATTENLSQSYDIFFWELTGPGGFVQTSNLTEPDFDLTQPGVYSLKLTASKAGNSVAPFTTAPKTIQVFARPRADFFFRQNQVYTGSEVRPVNVSVDGCDGCWLWDFGDGATYNVFEPVHEFTLEGRYTVSLEVWSEYDADGDGTSDRKCNDIAVADIRVLNGGKIKIPNAFTPDVNGPNSGTPDGNFTNDVFLPIMDGVEEFTMQIFDRWGNLLFQSTEQNQGWNGYDKNGRLMPAGVYVYKIVLRLDDGERTTKVGDITLIR